MADYSGVLLGMGNPLLDISAVVDDDFLNKYFASSFLPYCVLISYLTSFQFFFGIYIVFVM